MMFKSFLCFQSSLDTKDQREREISEYRHLLEELEKWLQGINLTLNTSLLPENLEEQVTVHEVLDLPKSMIILTLMLFNLSDFSSLSFATRTLILKLLLLMRGPKITKKTCISTVCNPPAMCASSFLFQMHCDRCSRPARSHFTAVHQIKPIYFVSRFYL